MLNSMSPSCLIRKGQQVDDTGLDCPSRPAAAAAARALSRNARFSKLLPQNMLVYVDNDGE
jgi:hypothetical protein